jgi:hypothetical protein
MDYLLVLKNGIGNKIFMLVNILHKYPKTNFYVVDQQSHHKEGKLIALFPALKELKHLQFIEWKEYDKLKHELPEIPISSNIYHSIDGFTPSIKKYFKTDESFNYDFTKGIFVHFRLGDKFEINLNELKKSRPQRYVVMKPEYYSNHISSLLEKKEGPVYVFSDEPSIAECLLGSDFEYPHKNVNEMFHCFRNAKRVILSDSTLSVSAVLLGSKKKDLIAPGYMFDSSYKLVKSPYFEGDSNPTYMMKTLEDYMTVVKKCKS